IHFCDIFFRMNQEIHIKWRRNTYWGNELQFTEQNLSIQQLLPILVKVFMKSRLYPMLQKIVEENYLYTYDMEINHICDLIKWLMMDDKVGKTLFNPQHNVEEFIYETIRQHISEGDPVHFDALMTFCLKPFTRLLVDVVGIGIDEMKREEEHQHFIQSARE